MSTSFEGRAMSPQLARQTGFALIEILVSLLIAAFGLVAMAGLQTRAAAMELEANQRAQALVLLQDMAERIGSNRSQASAYVGNNFGMSAAQQACDSLSSLAAQDVCTWSERLRGASVVRGGRNIGAMIGARGCVSALTVSQYVVTVAWQGDMPSAAPASPCGQGAYGAESLRRAVSTVVQMADLEAE
jgi:type IV pilus assembly protein PilV